MMKAIKNHAIFFGVLFALVSCIKADTNKKYNQLVKAELASGKRVDSIYLGIYFGMTSKQFYVQCWKLNKEGILTDGQSNTAVLYKLHNNELKHSASLNFFPVFTNDKISKMNASIQYDGWAPWNKHLFADSLLPDVVQYFTKWYSKGNSFIKMKDPEKRIIYVKVDGNRRILIGKADDTNVQVEYTDLLTESPVKN